MVQFSLISGLVIPVYIIVNILINIFLKTASETSRFTSPCNILFQVIAPLYLIPVLLKSSLTGGIWKWPANLVSCWWISQFLTKKGEKKFWDLLMIYTEHKTANQIFIDVYKFNDASFTVHCITIFPGIHMWYNTNGLVLKSSQFF